ncbi:MAG TPA: Holliday junction branch migration protein RuvA [Fusibacter sp.]|nr:Holliday junction branch migration protein RuvA [Fusibacter sp.]
MIDFIKGKLVHSYGDSVIVENNGIGFKIHTSIGSVADFSSLGEEVVVYTELIVREDSMSLVGFSSRDELNMFQLLTSVSGIGTKVGIGILSSMPFGQLAGIIASADIKSLQSAQGVGKKTAERLVLELKDKMPQTLSLQMHEHAPASIADQSVQKDALDALMSLGYTRSEAQGVLKQIDMEQMTVEDIIKASLKKLMF